MQYMYIMHMHAFEKLVVPVGSCRYFPFQLYSTGGLNKSDTTRHPLLSYSPDCGGNTGVRVGSYSDTFQRLGFCETIQCIHS